VSGPDDGGTIMVLMLAWGGVCGLTGYVLGRLGRRGWEEGPCRRESCPPGRPG
jgi:hypothetical protein